MTDTQGLYHKYHVRRIDNGRTVCDCVVLSFHDPDAWPALHVWADTVEANGNRRLADDLRSTLREIIDDEGISDQPNPTETTDAEGDR